MKALITIIRSAIGWHFLYEGLIKHFAPVSPKSEDDTRQKETDTDSPEKESYSRREALKDLATIPVLGLLGWGGYRSSKIYGADTLSGVTIQLNRVALGRDKLHQHWLCNDANDGQIQESDRRQNQSHHSGIGAPVNSRQTGLSSNETTLQ